MSAGAPIAGVEVFPPEVTEAERLVVSGRRMHPESDYLRALLASSYRQELLLGEIRDALKSPVTPRESRAKTAKAGA